MTTADIAVFGGSGFASFLDDVTEVRADTPYGAPSAPIQVGTLGEHRVAFLARHGVGHVLPPHRINYRANVWALRELGVQRIFGPCASGSLRADVKPGEFVVCDQLVDRTSGRADTFYDGPTVNHVSFADPYCPELRAVAVDACRAEGVTVHDGGTVVTIQGPRFSTRAESRWFQDAGWDAINMTQYPEAYLSRELGLCYASIALITDYDAGVEGDAKVAPVTFQEVMAVMDANVATVRRVLHRALAAVPVEHAACNCAAATNGLEPDPI